MADNDGRAGKEDGSSPLPAREIGGWATGGAIVLAAAGLGTGGVAVFVADSDVGAAALLVVGLYFAIVAMTGRVPRIKMGENEIDPRLAYEAGAAEGAVAGAAATSEVARQAAAKAKTPAEVSRAAEDMRRYLETAERARERDSRMKRSQDARAEMARIIRQYNESVRLHNEQQIRDSKPDDPPPGVR